MLCLKFDPLEKASVRQGGAPPGLLPGLLTCDCLLPFVHPLLSQVCGEQGGCNTAVQVRALCNVVRVAFVLPQPFRFRPPHHVARQSCAGAGCSGRCAVAQ